MTKRGYCPDWCGSVDWEFCKLKGHQFDSRSGCMPGLRSKFLDGGVLDGCFQSRTIDVWQPIDVSLSHISVSLPPFPLSLKVNKQNL